MDGVGRSEMGPFYCPIHYLSVQSIPSMRALASTNLSATFLRKIQQAMSSFLYREPHKTMIGFLMKSFHFRWTKPFSSWESQHFPWNLSFSIKNFWWNQREKVFDWILEETRKFKVRITTEKLLIDITWYWSSGLALLLFEWKKTLEWYLLKDAFWEETTAVTKPPALPPLPSL